MKKTILSLALTALFSLGAFAQESTPINENSSIQWHATKVTGLHYGSVAFQDGSLEFEDGTLTGGSFTVDMTTLGSDDLEGEWKGKLDGHLKSDDFFGIENHPTASLTFTEVEAYTKNSYKVTADLSIKEHTNTVEFILSIYDNSAYTNLIIDRSEYDIRYGSNSFFDDLGDKAIHDEFNLIINLEF